VNCKNCGSGIASAKCEYCGTLNIADKNISEVLSDYNKKKEVLMRRIEMVEKMHIPQIVKKKKIENIENEINNLKGVL